MDHETGEKLRDMETGETPAKPQLNEETGEREINCTQPKTTNKKPFKIPSGYIQRPRFDTKIRQNILTRKETDHKTSPIILFLLPTVFLAPIIVIILGVIEIILHIWAHKKNKLMRNSNIYFQSPLHAMLSEFCACCIDENMKEKITKMQDIRHDKFKRYSAEYIGRIFT